MLEGLSSRELGDLGGYRVVRRLGVGGMGEVYLAAAKGPQGVERPVAIKLVRDAPAHRQELVDLFLEEAKVAFLLTHPHITQTYELGRVDTHHFLVMEYVGGPDLGALMGRGQSEGRWPMPLGFALHLARAVARALAHAHKARDPQGQPLQLVHRDVSPSNVLVGYDGQVKLTDFGLAKSTLRTVHTEAGLVKGKLAYMAPEQLAGGKIGQSVDTYALGVILYEMLCGEHPFGEVERMAPLERYEAAGRVSPLGERMPGIDGPLAEVVDRAVAVASEARYPQGADLCRALDACARRLQLMPTEEELAAFVRETMGVRGGTAPPALEEGAAADPFDDALGQEIARLEAGQVAERVTRPPGASEAREAPAGVGSRTEGLAPAGVVPGVPRRGAAPGGVAHASVAEPSSAIRRVVLGGGGLRVRWALALLAVLAAGLAAWSLLGRRGEVGREVVVWDGGSRDGRAGGGMLLEEEAGSVADAHAGADDRQGRGLRKVGNADAISGSMTRPDDHIRARRAKRRVRPKRRSGGRRRAAAPARQPQGALSVNSHPWSIVYIDGKRLRGTPLVHHGLPAGPHRLLLVNPNLGIRHSRRIVVEPGKELRLSIELR